LNGIIFHFRNDRKTRSIPISTRKGRGNGDWIIQVAKSMIVMDAIQIARNQVGIDGDTNTGWVVRSHNLLHSPNAIVLIGIVECDQRWRTRNRYNDPEEGKLRDEVSSQLDFSTNGDNVMSTREGTVDQFSSLSVSGFQSNGSGTRIMFKKLNEGTDS
jgi:hypothetical protein